MKQQFKHFIAENIYRPTNRLIDTVEKNPIASVASFFTLSASLVFLLADVMPARHRRSGPGSKYSLPRITNRTYFNPLPRSIIGSHQGYNLRSNSGRRTRILRKGVPLTTGTAAGLAIFYLLRRKK